MDKELVSVIKQTIKEEVKPISDKLNNMETELKDFRAEFNDFKDDTTCRLDRIEKRNNATFEQTAELSEFRTETNDKLDDIKDDIAFLTKKETENEKDIFKLNKKVQ